MTGSSAARPRYAVVFLLALSLRGAWLAVVLSAHAPEQIARLFPDSCRYHALAQYLLGRGFDLPLDVPVMPSDPAYHLADGALLFSGPGYPMFLAAIYAVCGVHPLAAILLQAALSAASCVLVARIAHRLSNAPRAATLAGILAAGSLTSITLSVALLTETAAVFALLAAAALAIDGWLHRRSAPAVAAGCLLAVSILIKPAFAPLPMVGLAACGWGRIGRRDHRRQVRDALIACGIPLLVMGAVAARNGSRLGVPVVAANGPHSLHYCWAARATALTTAREVAAVQRAWGDELRARMLAGRITSYRQFHDEDVAAFLAAWRDRPAAMIRAYVTTVVENCIAPDELHAAQAPQFAWLWRRVDPWLRRALAPLLPVALAAGALVILRRYRRSRLDRPTNSDGFNPVAAVCVLVAWYAVFALISGAAFWQGSRYLFPALPAWCILVAWALSGYRTDGRRPPTPTPASAPLPGHREDPAP